MNDKIKEILDLCDAGDLDRCVTAIEGLPAPSSLDKQQKQELAAGLSSLFYRDHSINEGLSRVIVRAERSVTKLGADVIPWLLEQLEDADAESAEHFARVLGEIGVPAIAPLTEAINNASKSSYAMINFLLAVGYFSDTGIASAIPSVLEKAASEDHMVRSQAIYALGRVANRISASHFDDGIKEKMFDACFAGLSHTKAVVRRHSVRAMGKLLLNHYLTAEQEEKTRTAFRAILGLDNFDWDDAYIVRHEAHLWLKYIRQDTATKAHNEMSGKGAGRYNQDFRIIEKREVSPNTFYLKVNAPLIARKIEAGQFVIIRPNSMSERIPLSICGWDREQGYIELVIMAIGRTSSEATNKEVGDTLHDVVGPLGQRSHVAKYDGTCVVLGGGFGAGAIIPTARDLKALGNKVIGIIGARSKDLVLMVDELSAVCDEVIVTTNDGSMGVEGFVTTALEQVMNREKVSFALAVGPVPMMKAVADQTRDKGIECYVSLNAIMVDGTGMCGACRVTVDSKTRFACFHGPDFDGHKVNFEELVKRLGMFSELEKKSLEFAG
jgi:ferredoxin--NADP+ reductase